MASEEEPRAELAEKALPSPLLEAIRHVFAQGLSGCWLVGGTALSGFYAGHRRSDDMDLFTKDPGSQEAAVLAVRSLKELGASLEVSHHSAQYFKALCAFKEYRFTVDVALHAELFSVGEGIGLDDGIVVASLKTLVMMKAAALVSRCGEKDLYDLLWLSRMDPKLTPAEIARNALKLDAGATVEGLLLSVYGAPLSKESCGFALEPPLPPEKVFREIQSFKRKLLAALADAAEKEPEPPIGALIRRIRRMRKA